jgi:hypothetical protein
MAAKITGIEISKAWHQQSIISAMAPCGNGTVSKQHEMKIIMAKWQ